MKSIKLSLPRKRRVLLPFATSMLVVSCAQVVEKPAHEPDALQLEFGVGRMSAKFAQAGVSIMLEAARGAERTPEEIAADPSAPRFAISVRGLDTTGELFVAQLGGLE